VRDLQKVIDAISSPLRRDILTLVWDRELAAGQIAAAFDVTKPTVSQHLGVLSDAGLVRRRAVGTSRRYRARQEVLTGLRGALSEPSKWLNADDVPERALADAFTAPVVIACVEVPTDQMSTFSAFTDAGVYSRWLGVPVRIDDGDFSCTLEWGTEVRGRYELVAAPRLLVMRWDFDDGKEPEPGSELTAYLQVFPVPAGSRVEVHQLVDTAQQAEFMEGAWTLVLGRLKAGIVEALDAGADVAGRQPRAKRRAT
jgi:DNA-binding transcriptional ArsR family regulator/uncharacterized protein YndB with AHSA1/START domain